MPINRTSYHFYIYYWLLVIFAISLSLIPFFVSAIQFLLPLNWLLEGGLKKKFHKLKSSKALMLIMSIMLIHLLGMIYTNNFLDGLEDIKIKLPLLILPVIIGTSQSLNYKQLKTLLLFFTAGVVVSSLFSMSYFFGFSPGNIFSFAPKKILDLRDISIFISHIRFSLLINVAIFSIIYFLLFSGGKIKNSIIVIYSITIIWLISFLFILQSLTGIIIFIITGFILFSTWIKHYKSGIIKTTFLVALVLIPLIIFSYLGVSVLRFYNIDEVDSQSLDKTSLSGNPYWHDLDNKQVENGHYIGLYVCEKELRTEWNNISEFKYSGNDKKEQQIKYTLIRYLTSMGYRKDAEGVKKLNSSDIALIEEGTANYIYSNKWSFHAKIYQVIWQIDVYNKGGNPSGHSLTQRIEFIKAAYGIIKDNFFFGIGTGDLQESFNEQYIKMNSELSKEWRLRAHNQIITFFIAFGLVGFIWLMYSLIKPIFLENKQNDFFFMMFFIIAILSMFNEDTLEIQAGAGFFAFFYSLFLFAYKPKKIISS